MAFAGGITLIVLGCRCGRSLRRTSISTREHAEAARIVGRRAGGPDAAFVLDAARPAVYCVPGRPPTIVLTTGALAVLDPEQLAAVLAHERAHLAGRHHLLLAVTRSLAAVAPFVPLFARGAAEVARLAEMRADDAAVRRAGGDPERSAPPYAAGRPARHGHGRGGRRAGFLAARRGGVVTARVRRLAEPPAPGRLACYGLTLAAGTLAIAAAAVLVPVLAVTGS